MRLFFVVVNVLLLVFFLVVFGVKGALLFASIFSFLIWLHITVTSACNMFVGRIYNKIEAKADFFWKMLFLTIASGSFCAYFNV